MDRYLERVLRILEAEDKADREERRYWRSRGGSEAKVKAWFEDARKRFEEQKRREADDSKDEPKH
jgi:hypothetical protein